MFHETTITTFDGINLYFRKDEPASTPQATIVIVHGLCEHAGRYDYVTEKLLDKNLVVYRFDHRGHGRSEGQRVFYKDFHDIIEDVRTVVNKAKSENPQLPLFLIGHSMGGFASAAYGTKYPGTVNGFVLSGALTRYNTKLVGELPLDGMGTYFANELGDGVCSDPAVVKAYTEDPLVEKEISVDLINHVFGEGVDWLKEAHAQFVDPVFLLHGADDGLVSEEDSRMFFGDIHSTNKSLKIYAHLMHEIFNEVDKDAVITEAIDWIEKQY